MGDQEVTERIELEKTGSKCGSCNGMAGVRRDITGAINGVYCKGHQGECVEVRGHECPKHIHMCPTKAQFFLPILARAARSAEMIAA